MSVVGDDVGVVGDDVGVVGDDVGVIECGCDWMAYVLSDGVGMAG